MAAEEKQNPLQSIKRLFTPFSSGASQTGKAGDTGLQRAYESVTKISALMSERRRLADLESAETDKLDGLAEQLGKMDGERIQMLTEYRVSGDAGAGERAQALLKQCAEIGQEIDDARAVAGGIRGRITDLDVQLAALKVPYRHDLGVYLTNIHTGLIDQYNEAAPQLAEVVLKLAAIRRVMNKYGAGNTNGWNGAILLPGMQAGNGNYIEPLLDGAARNFDAEATARMGAIVEEMLAAGFRSRLV